MIPNWATSSFNFFKMSWKVSDGTRTTDGSHVDTLQRESLYFNGRMLVDGNWAVRCCRTPGSNLPFRFYTKHDTHGDQSKPSPSITDLWLQAKRVQSVRTPLTPYILLHSVQTKRIYQAATDRLTFRRLNLMASVTSLGFRNCNVEGKQLQDSKQTERLPGRDRTGAAFQFNEINSLVTETRLTRRSHRSKTRRKSANSNEKLQCQNGPESGRKWKLV